MLFSKLKVKPDSISIAMILLSFLSFTLMIQANETLFWIGVFISFLAFLFDKIDGDLARLYEMNNIKGAVYDFVYHRVSLFLFYLGIGIHFSYQNDYLIIISAMCGFIANYIEEMQLLSYRIFSHKYLLKKEPIIRTNSRKNFNESIYVKALKVFRIQLFLFYYLLVGVLLEVYVKNAVFYLICLALISMIIYSIVQLYYSINYAFDVDIENLLDETNN